VTGTARLLVVGVGGAGCNIVNHMIASNMRGVEFVAINTDTQALNRSQADVRLAIGAELTRGMGTGGHPAIGQQAAQESYHDLVNALDGADMVFITAGMGGGTGTGACPIIAQAAREVGALTLAIVTTPFAFERRRRALAEQGVAALRTVVDALITVPNERLAQLVGRDTSIFEAYRLADEALRVGVQGVSDLITIPGLVNLDFADVRSIMANAGSAYLATGSASGEGRAENALRSALSNPLLDVDITGARGLIFNVTGGDDLSMREVEQIANALTAAVHPDANLIFGATYDQEAGNSLKVTVVATGFEPHVAPEAHPSTWTPGRIPLAPGTRETRPDLSAVRPPSRPSEPSLPGRMVFDEPLPHLSQPPGQSYGPYGWVEPPPPWAQQAAPPYQQPPYQSPPSQPPQTGQQGGIAVTPINPPQPPQGQPMAQPSPAPGPARPGAPGAPRGGADRVVNPNYPREEYAENPDEQGAHPHEQPSRQGFWSRLFSPNPPNPSEPPHPPEGQHP
jgi:cell division protein FtsZ